MRKLILFIALATAPAYATITAGMQWDVRTTGSDNNGGGYDSTVTSPGTDFSQQDTAQIAFTDLVIGATTTQASSAANPFSSLYPGNVVNIISGSGCTTGRFELLSVSGTTATFDRSLGTAASTCTANLGGSLANVATALAAIGSNGNTVHVKAGTYSYSTSQLWESPSSFSVIGYQTTHLDKGTRPLITTATNSLSLITVGRNGGAGPFILISNVNFSNTAATRGKGIVPANAVNGPLILSDCAFDGFAYAVNDTGSGFTMQFQRVEIKNSTTQAIATAGSRVTAIDCYMHDNAIVFSWPSSGSNSLTVIGSIFANNGPVIADGNGAGIISVMSSTFYGTTGSAISQTGGALGYLTVVNSIFYGNSAFGISLGGPITGQAAVCSNNAFGSNGSGDVNNYTKSSTDVSLTANPFTNAASGDFSLNSTAGGGAEIKGAGFPGGFPGGLATGHLDIGAVQSACGGSASGFACGFSENRRPLLPR